jgi:HEAT repeat protein
VKFFLTLGFLCLVLSPLTGAADTASSAEERRLDVIRYGTENEIAALVKTLKNENADYLDEELCELAQNTHNKSILTEVFSFFGDRAREGLEGRAVEALDFWDDEAAETVLAAVDYLGRVKAATAIEPLRALLNTGEGRFLNPSFRALGRIGGGNPPDADTIAEYLMAYYRGRDPSDENRREIIAALGETASRQGLSFLSEIAENDDAGLMLRQTALEALSKIGDSQGLDAVLSATESTDPNVRSTAVAALGPFSGPAVDKAVIEAFRDSYYRTRAAAAKAAGDRKLETAVPYLSFRAERDEVLAVKEAAIRALGAIGSPSALSSLEALFGELKNADRVRLLAAEWLIQNAPSAYAERVITEMEDAKKKNQTALYNGLLRVIGGAKTGAVEDLARRFFASGGVLEKSYALDMTAANNFRTLIPQVQALTDEKNGNLARKARSILEKMDRPGSSPAGPDEPLVSPAATGGIGDEGAG